MPLTTPPGASAPLYARNKVTGETYYVGSNVSLIDDLGDVDTSTTGPTGGSALIWDDTVGQWVPGVASTVASLDDLTDVTTSATGPTGPTGPSHGQVLTWDETLQQWIPGVGGSEVEIGATMPTGAWELWVDEATELPTGTSGGGGANEVAVGPVDPYYLDPNSTAELWYDEGAVAAQAPPELPAGGAAGAVLTKLSATDRDVGWAASTNINAVLENGWAISHEFTNMGETGKVQFRVTATSVTFSMNIWRAAAVTGNAAVKICGYPSGVPAPWSRLMFQAWQYMAGLAATQFVAIEARGDGIYCLGGSPGYTGGSGNQSEKSLQGTVTWAR